MNMHRKTKLQNQIMILNSLLTMLIKLNHQGFRLLVITVNKNEKNERKIKYNIW